MRKMKDSGIEWIGQIPSDWDVIKLRYLIKGYKAGPFGSALITEKLEEDGSILVYTPEHIAEKTTNLEGNLYLPNERKNEMSQFFVKKNDIIFPIVGSLGRAMIIDETMPDGIINQRLAKFRLSSAEISIKFFLRLFAKSDFFTPYIDLYRRGSIILNLTKQIVYNMPIPIPPIDEQKKIADFLDEKCGEIDSIRSDIQKQIDILNDYKKSVITEAVTKGLNPKTKLKDSGIEWIGKIPEGWCVKKLKYVFAEGEFGLKIGPFGSALKDCVIANGDYKVYNQAHVISNDFSLSRHFVSEESYNRLYSYRVLPDDILFSMMGTIGKCRIMPRGYPKGIMDSHLLKARLKNFILPSFFQYVYDKDNSTIIYTQLEQYANGTIMNGLNSSIIKKLIMPVPPLSEQKAIADYLDEKCSEIDATIADKQRQLETLDEYKKSLIFEYVTGKKEVPT